jgi:RND family efflux transporter MFP subunit
MTDEPAPAPRRKRWWLVVSIALLIVGLAFGYGVWTRLSRQAQVRHDTEEMRIPTVAVVRPERTTTTISIVVPGSVQAYLDSPIFSRINGYLDRWLVDIGSHVKKDQLLAVISVPEVEQQLQQARNTTAQSLANLEVARATAQRFTQLAGTRAVSQQEVDTAVGGFQANQATVNANQALVRQLEQQLEFARIRAPFDGIITVRNVDVGDLINQGSSTTPRTELFHIVQPNALRVYVSVPEAQAQTVSEGLTAEVTFTTFPGHKFAGKVVRTARAIDPTTRVLNVELRVDNTTGILFAGAYAQVRLTVPAPVAWKVPVAALVFRKDGLQVATVVDHKIALKKVTAGHDHGEWIELATGIAGDELVVNNPSDSIADGEEVRIAAPDTTQAQR